MHEDIRGYCREPADSADLETSTTGSIANLLVPLYMRILLMTAVVSELADFPHEVARDITGPRKAQKAHGASTEDVFTERQRFTTGIESCCEEFLRT